jgi:hypothetical protein
MADQPKKHLSYEEGEALIRKVQAGSNVPANLTDKVTQALEGLKGASTEAEKQRKIIKAREALQDQRY